MRSLLLVVLLVACESGSYRGGNGVPWPYATDDADVAQDVASDSGDSGSADVSDASLTCSQACCPQCKMMGYCWWDSTACRPYRNEDCAASDQCTQQKLGCWYNPTNQQCETGFPGG